MYIKESFRETRLRCYFVVDIMTPILRLHDTWVNIYLTKDLLMVYCSVESFIIQENCDTITRGRLSQQSLLRKETVYVVEYMK